MSSEQQDLSEQCAQTLRSVDEQLHVMLRNDRFLNNLIPRQSSNVSNAQQIPSTKSVKDAIQLHYGRAMWLTLQRGDGIKLSLVVPITARVLELRQAVQMAINDYLEQQQHHLSSLQSHEEELMEESRVAAKLTSLKFISWRSVWRTHCLAVVNPQPGDHLGIAPAVICLLTDLHGHLQDRYNVRNGCTVTFVKRLKRTI